MTAHHVAVPPLDHELVARTDVKTSRPALEAAGYRCEVCRRDDGLRVVAGWGQLAVLCPQCRAGSGFQQVLARRKHARMMEARRP
jgi:hypothetical protein